MIDFKHLSKAVRSSNQNIKFPYFWHFKVAITEAISLQLLAIASLIHAFLPWLFEFKLLELQLNRIKVLKNQLPNDERLKNIEFK